MNSARERAEDLLQNLQDRAREWLDAEEGLSRTVRDLINEHGLSPSEVRKRLEDLVGRLKGRKVWNRLMNSDGVVALSEYRDELERMAEHLVQRAVEHSPVAAKGELTTLQKQVKSLNRKLTELSRKVKDLVAP